MERREREGYERVIWRRLPAILIWGTVLPLLFSGVWHWSTPEDMVRPDLNGLSLIDYALIGAVIFHWTMVFTVGLACYIVMVMKGPVQQADPYPLPELPPEMRPEQQAEQRSEGRRSRGD
jgi:hypothetical protein